MVSSPVQNPITDQEDPGDRDTILVVEDDPQCASLLKVLLEDEGHPVVLASTGGEGQRILRDTAISLVLLDLRLPDMNGTDLMQDVQRLDAPPEVVVITAHATLESAIKAIEAGAAGYILKPVDPTRFRALVGKVLERRRLQRENAALHERVDRERRRLQALYEVSRHLISVRDIDDILSLIVRETSRLLGAEAVALRLLEGEEFVLKAYTELAGALISRTRVSTRASLSGLVLAAGEPVVIEDLPEDTRHDPAYTQGVASLGFRGFLGVPLRIQGETIGALNVYTKSPRGFTPDEVSLLSALADQASLAIDAARLFLQEQKRRRHLEAVRAIGVEIIRELDLPTLLGLIIRRAAELVGAVSGAIYIWREAERALTPEAWIGHGEWLRGMRISPGEGVTGTVAQRREGLIVNDYRASPYCNPVFAERSGFTAVLAKPLLYQDRLVGVIAIDNTGSERVFVPEDGDILDLFAPQAAIAIENARLYSESQEREREATKLSKGLALLSQTSRGLHRTLDVDAVLGSALEDLATAFGAGSALVRLFSNAGIERSVGRWLSDAHGRDITHRAGGIANLVRQTGSPVVLRDLAERPDLVHPAHVKHGVKSLAALPILGQSRQTLGVLFLYYTRAQTFPDSDLQLLTAYAEHIGIALENAQLYTAAEQRARELATLREIGQAITNRLELPAVLQAVVAGAMRLLGTQHAQIVLWDEATRRLTFGSARGPEAERARSQTFRLGQGVNGTVALTRQPMILDDYQTSPYALPGFPDIVATITVPVLFGDRLLGVLHSHATQPGRHFTTDDLRLLQLLADQAAVVIENARLLQEVEAQRAHLAQVFESASDAIVVANGRGNIFSWNRAAQHMFEYTEEEVLGRPLTLLMPESLREAHKSGLDRMRSGAEPHVIGKTVEFVAVRKGGTEFPIELSLAVLKASDGTYFSGIIRDITVRKQADQMKSDFVSFVTHQLRTPLAGIKWLLELAEQEPAGSEEVRSYIQDARESNERLIRLVNELLDVSRLERGKLNIVPQETRLDELTRSVLEELKPLFAAKGHRLSVRAGGEVPPVWVDPQLLRQVILNLASNAIKYTRPQGEIAIRMTQEGTTLRWAIQDSGIGIPKETQHRLFEKFYRADNAQTIETEGTGLGLYLVRLILEQFGGRVWCESEEGKGATFLFTLPCPGRNG